MIPRPAQYLLRFDDLCPTISQRRWQRIQPLMDQFQIKPILAVIPDNRDYKLQVSPADPEFWEQMRSMEANGATIGLHGYQHLCRSWDGSLLPLHRRTEFANVDLETQREWIHAGLQILRGHGLNPRLWVAPRHGFDRNTLLALRSEGIGALSDGFARVPFKHHQFIWIPQQLWAPVKKSKGLWTICVHANTARGKSIDELHDFLRAHRAQFTSVDKVLAEFGSSELSLKERAYERAALWRAQWSHVSKRLLRRSQHSSG
jgi:predicted deacetylase